ncbi:MAG: hypothetical protein F6K17_08435 [Okeania sp. SIO3C4]|nr:hypothetical protein [Okeania sp. SIO3B3]NER02651.1 hypothetical protein [Okeania sp. SIO3C4]
MTIATVGATLSPVIVFIISLKVQTDRNTYDLSRMKEVIEKDILDELGADFKELDDTFDRYSASTKKIQIRLNHLEDWAENQGYSRVRTATDFEERDK